MNIKYKYIIIVAALGIVVNIIAGFLMILHWETPFFGMGITGRMIRFFSIALFVVAVILLVVKLFEKKEKPRFE
jgi:uncharacterized membrane protein